MNGIELITAERQRQISSERWNDDHDDEHEDGALAMAAVCYAACEPVYIQILLSGGGVYFKDPWPWDCDFDKRPMAEDGERVYDLAADVRIRQLVKAGALIAAEIDRLQRASMKASRDEHRELDRLYKRMKILADLERREAVPKDATPSRETPKQDETL